MKDTLVEIKESMSGIIGSFVVGSAGEVSEMDVPQIMEGSIKKVSKTIHHVSNVIKSSKPLEKMTIDSETSKVIALTAGDRMLCVIAEKNLNLPLFKLMANMAISKIKEEPAAPAGSGTARAPGATPAPKAAVSEGDAKDILAVYGKMFDTIAKKLTIMLGPQAANIFADNTRDTRNKHNTLFRDVAFEATGRPQATRLIENAKELSVEEIKAGLDDMAAAMVETVKSTAGPKMAERAELEVTKIREDNKDKI